MSDNQKTDIITRRDFLCIVGKYGLTLSGVAALISTQPLLYQLLKSDKATAFAGDKLQRLIDAAPVARYWVSNATSDVDCSACHEGAVQAGYKHSEVTVRCLLCANRCFMSDGERGRCRARINDNGVMKSLVYGRPITTHIDPIEKKPFYHFMPRSKAFSLATSGCALHCKFCQNWEISQSAPEDYSVAYTSPSAIVSASESRKVPIIAFTYNEPTVFTEYITDIARLANSHGLRSVLISCGFMNEEPLKELCDVLSAIKIDLKGFSDDFYWNVCSAHLAPVLRSIKQVARSGRHLEIVNLVVPTLNDSDKMLHGLVDWVLGEIGPDVPVHFTRFHPDYQMLNLPPTPIATLEKARDIAMEKGIHYAFAGNVPGHPGNHTYCPGCGKIVISRQGFFVSELNLVDGKCKYCNTEIKGVWS